MIFTESIILSTLPLTKPPLIRDYIYGTDLLTPIWIACAKSGFPLLYWNSRCSARTSLTSCRKKCILCFQKEIKLVAALDLHVGGQRLSCIRQIFKNKTHVQGRGKITLWQIKMSLLLVTRIPLGTVLSCPSQLRWQFETEDDTWYEHAHWANTTMETAYGFIATPRRELSYSLKKAPTKCTKKFHLETWQYGIRRTLARSKVQVFFKHFYVLLIWFCLNNLYFMCVFS